MTDMSRLRTPLTELVGVEHPVVQTGMGWVAGAAAGVGHRQRRRARHPGLGDHDARRAAAAVAEVKAAPTSRSASTCAPTPATRSTGSTC